MQIQFLSEKYASNFLSKLNSIANWIYGHCCLPSFFSQGLDFSLRLSFTHHERKIELACIFGPWKVLESKICFKSYKIKTKPPLKRMIIVISFACCRFPVISSNASCPYAFSLSGAHFWWNEVSARYLFFVCLKTKEHGT